MHVHAKRALGLVIAGVVVLAGVFLLVQLFRARTATLIVQNASGREVREIELLLSLVGKGRTETCAVLAAAESWKLAYRCSDVVVVELSFRIGDRAHIHKGGIVTWGETLVLSINEEGLVRERYLTSKARQPLPRPGTCHAGDLGRPYSSRRSNGLRQAITYGVPRIVDHK